MQENLIEFAQNGPVTMYGATEYRGPRNIESVGFANFQHLVEMNEVQAEVRLFLEGTDQSSPAVVVRTSVPVSATDTPEMIQSNLYLSAAKLFRQIEVNSAYAAHNSYEMDLAG